MLDSHSGKGIAANDAPSSSQLQKLLRAAEEYTDFPSSPEALADLLQRAVAYADEQRAQAQAQEAPLNGAPYPDADTFAFHKARIVADTLTDAEPNRLAVATKVMAYAFREGERSAEARRVDYPTIEDAEKVCLDAVAGYVRMGAREHALVAEEMFRRIFALRTDSAPTKGEP